MNLESVRRGEGERKSDCFLESEAQMLWGGSLVSSALSPATLTSWKARAITEMRSLFSALTYAQNSFRSLIKREAQDHEGGLRRTKGVYNL